MKTVVILGDGMADEPIERLGDRTPLDVAFHPNMDQLASRAAEFGLARTVPHGLPAGSDVANLSVFGFDPQAVYTGRSPLEAASIGISLQEKDVTYRCNLVCLSDAAHMEDATMLDYAAGEITTEEAAQLISFLNARFADETQSLYTGISYRHILLLHDAETGAQLTPPHDISGQTVKGRLPRGTHAELMREIMEYAYQTLRDHPVNVRRRQQGLPEANAVWFWGEGRRPSLPRYDEAFRAKGMVISAVDLIRGIGKCTGMEVPKIEGATGTYHTNFNGKAEACISALKNGYDFVYIHMEAADECGHQGLLKEKIYSIEQMDRLVLAPVWNALEAMGEDYRILLMPDHPTPYALRTHTDTPVPYVLYRKGDACDRDCRYTERDAKSQTDRVVSAHKILWERHNFS